MHPLSASRTLVKSRHFHHLKSVSAVHKTNRTGFSAGLHRDFAQNFACCLSCRDSSSFVAETVATKTKLLLAARSGPEIRDLNTLSRDLLCIAICKSKYQSYIPSLGCCYFAPFFVLHASSHSKARHRMRSFNAVRVPLNMARTRQSQQKKNTPVSSRPAASNSASRLQSRVSKTRVAPSQGGDSKKDGTRHERSEKDTALADKKLASWTAHSTSSPFPNFRAPTEEQCRQAHKGLFALHDDEVKANFARDATQLQNEGQYDQPMEALVVAALSQATSWSNAKRAMAQMSKVYGSTFAYQAIVDGGVDRLRDALRPGGMQNRKSKILNDLLHDVRERHGSWDLRFLFDWTDDDIAKEVMSYRGLGPKCLHCFMSICMKRDKFAVDTHIYRISGLWGWRPAGADMSETQAHLDARVPDDIKFALHYELIVHGQRCPKCRAKGGAGRPSGQVKCLLTKEGEESNQTGGPGESE